MPNVLLVDDDVDLTRSLSQSMKLEKYVVQVVHSGALAKEHLLMSTYDVIILDWQLPEISGLELCQIYRAQGGQTPILFLTGRSAIVDKEDGLNAGGDDYLTKPFHVRELFARLRALLRRQWQEESPMLKARGIELDPSRHKVSLDGVEISLTRAEFSLLQFFMMHPNQVFTHESILEKLWANQADQSVHALRQYVLGLRKAIHDDKVKPVIRSIHGIGYRFEP